MTTLEDIKAFATGLSPWAHLATVGADGEPDVVRLWDGVFDYDLNAFAPGGPDNAPNVAFMAINPTRALLQRQYGMGGKERWRA